MLLHKARTKARASSMPVHNRCNEIKNISFFSSHACSRGDDTGDTLLLHKACTKAHASSMPVYSRDGHGIPKCSPCPSVVFLMLPGLSVRFRVFLGGGEYVCLSYGPLIIPKIGKIGAKIRASIY